jgi:hypothetical protein
MKLRLRKAHIGTVTYRFSRQIFIIKKQLVFDHAYLKRKKIKEIKFIRKNSQNLCTQNVLPKKNFQNYNFCHSIGIIVDGFECW